MRRLVALVVALLLVSAVPAAAQDKVKIGVLKLTSSAPIFVGVEKPVDGGVVWPAGRMMANCIR